MFTNRDVGRLERALRSAEAPTKIRALREISGLAPEYRTALLAAPDTEWSPLLQGSLLALEAGTVLDADSLPAAAVEALARTLGGRSAARRKAARIALVHGNVSLAAAQPILERLARDRRSTVRAAVGDVLIWGTPLETSDFALVEEMLRDPWLRNAGAMTAAHLLRRLLSALTTGIALPAGKTISQSIPPVGSGTVVHALAGALGTLPELSAGLVTALGSRETIVRVAAVRGLASLGAATTPATPALIRALADRDTRVSEEAARALRAFNRLIDVPAVDLQAMLTSRWPHVRANAVRCLPFARTDPPNTWESFLRALADPAMEVRSAAAETLRHWFERVPDEVFERLRRLVQSRSRSEVRMTAAHSMAHLAGGDAAALEKAIAALIAGMRARDARVRLAASYALSCLGETALAALPDLLRAAKSDPDFNVRARALWAFRAMGPRAQAAAALLRQLLRGDPNEHIRRFATEALAAVQGESK